VTDSTRIAELLKAVQGWEEAFDHWVHRIGLQVPRADTRQRVTCYIQSLLGEVERRNSWQLAASAGHMTPYAFQHVLGRANWDVEGVRDEVRTYVYDHLHAADDALVIDETGFLQQGNTRPVCSASTAVPLVALRIVRSGSSWVMPVCTARV